MFIFYQFFQNRLTGLFFYALLEADRAFPALLCAATAPATGLLQPYPFLLLMLSHARKLLSDSLRAGAFIFWKKTV